MTQRDFFQRLGAVPAVCTPEQLDRRGNVFYLRVDASGFKRSGVGIKWFTYDVGNLQRVPGVRSNDRETTVFRPRAPINRQIAPVWVPWPLQVGDFFVRFELYSGDVLRALVDSPAFSTPPPRPGEDARSWCKPLSRGHGRRR